MKEGRKRWFTLDDETKGGTSDEVDQRHETLL